MSGTVSYWQRSWSGARAQRASLPDRELEVDVAVVGGGICGVSLALELESRGTRVAVIERGAIASGASGKNAGFLMRGAADNYARAIEVYGRETARLLWRWSEENLELLRSGGAASLSTYQARPSCLIALDGDEEAELRRSHALLREDGFDSELIERGEDSLWRSGLARVGLLNPGDGAVNPCELVAHLVSKLEGPVYEGCEVGSVGVAPDSATLEFGGSRIRAERIVFCTNALASRLVPRLGPFVRPNRGQMLALRGDGLILAASYYVNRGHEYLRQTPDGTIAVGGMRGRFAEEEQTAVDQATQPLQDELGAFAALMLATDPDADLHITDRWAGIMAFTPDGLPLIGPLDPDRRVWFCGGFNGHGMSLARRCARACAVEMLDGERSPFPLSRFVEAAPIDQEQG